MSHLSERVEERAREWGVVVEDALETHSSFVGFGTRGGRPVVLKVLRRPGDEWRCGAVLDAFGGGGMVRVYEYVEGAVLLERLSPGTPLAVMALNGRDDEATEILADVIRRMSPRKISPGEFVTVEDWGKGFERYLAGGGRQIPRDLVEHGQRVYAELCASQRATRLLHGDLHHYNVLFDADRGWVAIDPKGVVGELEYEIGATLRNPYERPELFTSPETVERRVMRYAACLKIDAARVLSWGFAQAVLSAIWSWEDGFEVGPEMPVVVLARAIQPMLK